MIPLLEPATLFAPVTVGLAWLSAIAVAGTAVVVGLVVRAGRPPRSRGVVVPFLRRLPKAA